MQPNTLTRQQCRQIDQRAVDEYGMSSIVLMENAGRGTVDTLLQLGANGEVVVCCGKGNNAGDGFVIARHLDIRCVPVRVFLVADPEELSGDALANYRILTHSDVPIHVCGDQPRRERFDEVTRGAAWLVDALLGTGAKGEPRDPMDRVIDWMNEHLAKRLAVDVPSGLDCDTGEPASSTIRAALTCTFVASKPGFEHPHARPYVGTVHVQDIGVPRRLVEEMLRE
ncbi:MAG: NAD(P)H-hydrate epimerase [Pirellulales bacterium]